MKFGGTSVATVERIRNVARHVKREIEAGYDVAVVVSAMSGKTNELVGWVKEASALYDSREYDVVVASGEQVTSGLLAIALQEMGLKARSWQGWQIPIQTSDAHGSARIAAIDGTGILDGFARDREVAVVSGFQGMHQPSRRITTLGRGGSDTSAVALAAAIQAERCDIYTDVDGVYTTDPRITRKARKLGRISYEEMLELASLGAKVLNTRSVELAMARKVPVRVLSSFVEPEDIKPGWTEGRGTLVCEEDDVVEQRIVSGVAYSRDEAKITLLGLPNRPGVPAGVFRRLAEANVNVDMIVQSRARASDSVNMEFTVPKRDAQRTLELMQAYQAEIGFEEVRRDDEVAKISVVGVGMRSHAGVAETMFAALGEKGVTIQVISTSEIKISVLIDAAYTELAVRALHAAYGLDKL